MPTILVVDDAPISREPVAACLRLAGYKTICAANGQEALFHLQRALPDLVLLDVDMPVLDGIATLKRIRANPAWAQLRVIMLTTATDQRFIEQAATLRPADYMLKSHFSLQELLARVERHLPASTAAA